MSATSLSEAIRRVKAHRVGVILALIGFFFPVVLVLLHSHETSPIDEWVFVDYTSKVFEQGYVHEGERIGGFTAELMACQGILPGTKFGTCGDGTSHYESLPYTGLTAAAAYTPAYFWATRILGLPFQILGADPLTAWRLTGAVWLSAGLATFYALLRAWGVTPRRILPLGLLVVASPFVWWANSFVSTDAPSIFVGAGLLFLATKVLRRDVNPLWLIPAAGLASAFKVTNLVSIGLISIFLIGGFVFRYFNDRRKVHVDRRSRWAKVALPVSLAIAVIFSVGIQLFWAKLIVATSVSAERVDQGISGPLNPAELALQVVNFLPNAMSFSVFSGHGRDYIWLPLGWLSIAGVIGSFMLIRKWNDRTVLVTAIFLSSILMAPLLAVAVQIAQGAYFQLSPRYGASLIPAFLLCVGFLLRNRVAQSLLLIYAIGLFAVGLFAGITVN